MFQCFVYNESRSFFKKCKWLFSWIGSNCLKAVEPCQEDSFLLTTKFPGVSGTCLINLQKDETLTQPVDQSLIGLEPNN